MIDLRTMHFFVVLPCSSKTFLSNVTCFLNFSEARWHYCSSRWSLVGSSLRDNVNFFSSLFSATDNNELVVLTLLLLCLSCSMFPRSTHDTFAQKLYQTFKNHKRFSKPKLARSDFTICHYAGDVSFNFVILCIIPFIKRLKRWDSASILGYK